MNRMPIATMKRRARRWAQFPGRQRADQVNDDDRCRREQDDEGEKVGSGAAAVGVEALLIRARRRADRWLAFARPASACEIGDALHVRHARRPRSRPSTKTARSSSPSIAAAPSCWPPSRTPAPCRCRPTSAAARPTRATAPTTRPLFARADGAVAAPTAGLHFTPELLAALEAARRRARACVTLHVGAGTFQPVRADDTAEHTMHAEWGEVPQATADAHRTRARRRRPHRRGRHHRRCACSRAARATMTARCRACAGETDIFITPGYRFRAVDVLMTNFHLPRSTLFMLVSAFAGLERMKRGLRACHRRAATASIPTATLPAAATDRLMRFSFDLLATDGAARRGRLDDRARHDRDAGLHAGRHRRHGQGDAAAVGRRDRRARSCSATPST